MSDFGPHMPAFSELVHGIRRIVAPNPSMMTGPGTNTYLIGDRAIAVLDPGPGLREHVDDIIEKAAAPIRWIIVTHTHPDHSPAAVLLAEKTGAELLGMPPPEGEHQDMSFAPTRILGDGDTVLTSEFCLHAVHTPGHASNHLCFRHEATNWIFTGDHVIDGSTVVINPPDGNMKHYLESLRRVKELKPNALLPGHGGKITKASEVIDWIIEHRLDREAKVFATVRKNPEKSTRELVPLVYTDVPEKLYAWAERSLLAHLIKLDEDGIITQVDDRWMAL